MLVDINAYTGHWPFKQLKSNSCEGILERMKEYGTDLSVITNLHGVFYKNTQSANNELYDEIRSKRAFNDRFLPFGIINPIYAGWKEDFKTCTEKMGMKGIRVFPNYHDYTIDDPNLIELVKMARDKDVVVALTMRIVDVRQRSWMDLSTEWTLKDYVPLVRAVPDAKYMMLNLATGIALPEADEATLKQAQVLFDTSGRHIMHFANVYKRFGKDKFAFGTHFPVLDYYTGLLRIDSLRPDEADAADIEAFRSGNARRMLRL
ncbi:amidohydrolase family protein [Chitinophaga lutea]